jgi:transposase
MNYFIGLDVHLRHISVCILNRDGKKVQELRHRGTREELLGRLAKLGGPLAICFEASCGYGHLYEQLGQVAERVVVAHPGQLRLIFRSKRKHDRADAEKLAKLLFLGEVPAVHVPDQDVRAWRQFIEHRTRLVNKRTRVKNALGALLRSLGIIRPRGQGRWSKRDHKWLQELALPTALCSCQRDTLLDELELFDRQIARVEHSLEAFAESHPGVSLLRTIPGVGPRTAEAVVAYLDSPERFHSNKSVGCYLGLVPSQDQSGPTNRLGHITREGPATVRRLLAEAAWQGVLRSGTIRSYFLRIGRDDPQRKKIALVATAHYLARVMLAMLRTGEGWREQAVA